jgi:exonuclease III
MKIVSWNCHYGFDGEKPETIKKLDADIFVIQECREKDMEGSGFGKTSRDWYGDHKETYDLPEKIRAERDLGIGIFWKEIITITRLPEWENVLSKNDDFRYLIPYKVVDKEQVEGKILPFTLIAVWTKNKMDMTDPLDYVQKAHAAIDHYTSIGLLNGKVVLIGDFNSNTIWDDQYRKDRNHSALIEKLKKLGIKNCSKFDGESEYSTYYYYPCGQEKHVIDDYCFASASIADSAKFSVPGIDDWIPNASGKKLWRGLSDHCPIIVDFTL